MKQRDVYIDDQDRSFAGNVRAARQYIRKQGSPALRAHWGRIRTHFRANPGARYIQNGQPRNTGNER